MLLETAHHELGWPSVEQVLKPEGAGARVYAEYAQQKIGEALRRKFRLQGVRVNTGILAADPNSNSTEAPIAVVCEFPDGAGDDVLDEAHRLAWNFSRTALLITLEPRRLIAWSCCQHPREPEHQRKVCELPTPSGELLPISSQQRGIRDLLHWVSLITGRLLNKHPKKFPADGRADALLLKNLRHIRKELLTDGMPEHVCHDVLARLIFTQFLFHRKDRDGRPFFDGPLLADRCGGALKKVHPMHDGLSSVLQDKGETYALFRWLDEKFNGDLFPGKENQSEEAREQAWQDEQEAVTEPRLKLLADFVSGKIESSNRQLALWPLYSFDTIPLEFISSVYEEFLNEKQFQDKAYYTPPHLVDFVLDAVLPWEGDEWDLKILDPSCGSGIFLVKAFQRLIHRWRNAPANRNRDPLVSDLKPILANNLVGVDKNPEAVRVACFSLYLAMADAIEPKYYLKREQVFPPLRGRRLIAQDFFDESTAGLRTTEDAGIYHLVIGNAPWGDKSIKSSSAEGTPVQNQKSKKKPTKAEQWAKTHDWPTPNNDIGPVFLGKAAKLVRDDGRVAMVQPASTLLHQRAGLAEKLRRKLFTEFSVDEVTNLSAVRREVFANAISPACILVFGVSKPGPSLPLLYCTPKPQRQHKVERGIAIEPQDCNSLTHQEAASDALIWTVLALGSRRDWRLVQRVSRLPTLEKLSTTGEVMCRLGVIPGDEKQELQAFRGKRYFSEPVFPDGTFLQVRSESFPKQDRIYAAATYATDPEAFKLPQLLIKQSFSATEERYRAVRVVSDDQTWGVVCKKTYLSVRDFASDAKHIEAAKLAYNSRFAAYFLNLTSSRALYNTELLSGEVRSLPLPTLPSDLRPCRSFTEIDELMEQLLKLNAAESTLLDDFLTVTLPSLLRKKRGTAYAATSRKRADLLEPELAAYARTFARVVKSTFGDDKAVCATVFQEVGAGRLPVRMVGIHLDWPGHPSVKVEKLENDELFKELGNFYNAAMKGKGRATAGDGLGFQRVAFLFHSHREAHGRVRSLCIIKPDECRYWTRSLAMRDADQLAAAILKAAGRKSANA